MAYIVSFLLEERDCSLTPKAEAPPGTRGRFGGIPFKEDPNAPRPRERRTLGRRYRQREQERNHKKKGIVRSAGMPEKSAETCFGKMERICRWRRLKTAKCC